MKAMLASKKKIILTFYQSKSKITVKPFNFMPNQYRKVPIKSLYRDLNLTDLKQFLNLSALQSALQTFLKLKIFTTGIETFKPTKFHRPHINPNKSKFSAKTKRKCVLWNSFIHQIIPRLWSISTISSKSNRKNNNNYSLSFKKREKSNK